MKSRQALIRQIADEHNFTIRRLYQCGPLHHRRQCHGSRRPAGGRGTPARRPTTSTSYRPGCPAHSMIRRRTDDSIGLDLQRRHP